MWLNVNTLMVHKMVKESQQLELSGVAQMGSCVKGVSQNLLVEKMIVAQFDFSQISLVQEALRPILDNSTITTLNPITQLGQPLRGVL